MSRFLLGFAIGAAIGVAVVILTTPRSGDTLRRTIGDTVQGALEAARQAQAARERALWAEFRTRLPEKGPDAGNQQSA